MLTTPILAVLALVPYVLSHGHQVPISNDADWATRHMAGSYTQHSLAHSSYPNIAKLQLTVSPSPEEHHIANLDPSAFFSLHDFNNDGVWTSEEIRRTYGLDDESVKDIDEGRKGDIVQIAQGIFDRNEDGMITREEWMDGWVKEGKRLPDFGTGPGHHGDDEYEYEIHHFEKFHDENTREEDLTHPEDIAHFKKHDEMDAQAEYQEQIDSTPINEQNIPQKFRRY